MNQLDAKQILVEFGHWIALGVSVVLVGVALLVGGDVKSKKEQKKIQKSLDRLTRAMKSNKAKLKSIPDYYKISQGNWTLATKAEQGPLNEYLYQKAKITFKHAVPPTHQWINKPEGISVEVDREKITVSWDVPPALFDSKGKQKEKTNIVGYHLMKRWMADGRRFEKIEEIKSEDKTSFEDTRVEAKIKYYYKVRAFSDNTEAKGGELINFNGKKIVVSDYTNEKHGKILPLYRLKLLGIAGNTAIIQLSKWVKGEWRKTICHIKKREKIAKKVYIEKVGSVNFDPDWTLKYLNARATKVRIRIVKKPRIDSKTGKPVVDERKRIIYDSIKKREKYINPVIGYIDDKGKRYKVYKDSK